MRAIIGPQNIAGVAVAMQPDIANSSRAVIALCDAFQRVVRDGPIRGIEIRGHKSVLDYETCRRFAEACDVEERPVPERSQRAHRMHAPQETAEPAQDIGMLEFRRASRTLRKQGKAETLMRVERRTAGRGERRDHRNFAGGKLEREAVLFEYRIIAPALRPIELRNQHHAVFEPHLVDAVLKAVKRILPAVAAITTAFDGVEYQIRREILVR